MPSNPSKDYYFIHRQTGVTEPVLIEYGFVDNASDANFIKNNWQDLAEAVVRAVATYVGASYDGVEESSIYVVQRGDSLYSIAKKFDITVDALKSANNLQNNLISIGQKLVVPGFTESTGSNINYVVQKGDSLYSIASKYNTTVNDIKALNNLSSNILNVGQIIRIPTKETVIIEPDLGAPTNTYIVQFGDTLYTIANNNNISVDELIRLNNLTDLELYVGQILKLPTLAGEEEIIGEDEYVVQKGDSLYSIARVYGITVDELKRLNNLTSNMLDIGQVLKISSLNNNVNVGNTYTVQKGDNLYSIARTYGVTVDDLKRVNNLISNTLSIGQILNIPGNNNTNLGNTYIVKSGDTLYSIARAFNTTLNDIKALNNLSSNVISVGQTLKIPS